MADLLGELCLALQKDTDQEARTVKHTRRNADGQETSVLLSEVGQPKRAEVHAEPKVGSLSPSLVDALVATYKTACETENVAPCEEHVRLLTSVPGELVFDARRCLSCSTEGTPGGAVLRVTGGCTRQIGALLETLAPPPHASAILVLDTLDLTGVNVSHEALSGMLGNALWWGPWWRLRCLVLRNCDMTPAHIRALGRLETVPCFWNLEVLDLSENILIGTDPTTGAARAPDEYAGAEVAFLIYLWKQAKLRRISFKGCNLGMPVTECLLKVLCSYHVPREQKMECGVLMHSGARFSLECLELGTCDDAIMDTLASLVRSLPKLSCLDVPGLSQDARYRLHGLMRDARGEQAGDRKEMPSSSGGMQAYTGVIAGNLDGTHSEDGTATNKYSVMGDEVIKLDANETAMCTAAYNRGALLPPSEHVLPEENKYCMDSALDGVPVHPTLPRQILDDLGLNEVVHRPASAPAGATKADAIDGGVILMATNALDKYSLNIVSPRKIARSSEKFRQKYTRREKHAQRGVDIDHHEGLRCPARVEIRSESDVEDDDESATSDSNDDNDGHRGQEKPSVEYTNFKLRDGALDEDSKLGRIYRATAKRNIASLPVSKQKRAKRAFSLWDQCTENSWDRRRWDNPSKTQNDEPHILGQLNLLFDILHEEGLGIGFPFPLWRRGEGANAFLSDHRKEDLARREPWRCSPAVEKVEVDVVATARARKRHVVLMSDSDDEI